MCMRWCCACTGGLLCMHRRVMHLALAIHIFKSKTSDLSRTFPIPRVTKTIRSCDPMCQIRKILVYLPNLAQSSFFGTLAHKQSRRCDCWTYSNFPDHYLKNSIMHVCTRFIRPATSIIFSILIFTNLSQISASEIQI